MLLLFLCFFVVVLCNKQKQAGREREKKSLEGLLVREGFAVSFFRSSFFESDMPL